LVSVSRNGVLALREGGGAEKEHYDIPFGARLRVAEGKKVESGEIMAEWDPYSLPIVTEHEGTVKLQDVIDGITMHEEKNRITGLIERVIIEHRAEQLHPQVVIMDGGKKKASYPLPVDTNIVVHDGDKVEPGDVLAKIPQEVSKTQRHHGRSCRAWRNFSRRANRATPR
jgi:DNA-directed RNA polymerase subunit beta'